MKTPLDILRARFGFENFRLNQKEVITSVLQQRDTFVLMPTGGGKSLCYQIPALIFEGLTVVISPLIALMKDQVDALRLNGVPAAYLNSTLSFAEQESIKRQLSENKLKLLYLAPERLLRTENEFISFLRQLRISLVAIDEAHCISQWGHDFRPEYLMLSRLKQDLPGVPIIALTATADKLTRKDILEKLELKNPGVFVSSFNRPNIRYTVEPKKGNFERLVEFLSEHSNDSGIIYCLSRASTESLAADLQHHGFNAVPYHAGLEREVRARHQDLFVKDEVKIVVATIAFGMGIDKSNVRFVIHMDLPKSVEGYYQETGRAGRDGLDSEAVLFFSAGDVMKLKKLATVEGNDEQTRINYMKLDKMARYGDGVICRRKYLLNYFDEQAAENCGNCDICMTQADMFDATTIAQKALSAVVRVQERFGAGYIIDLLRGSGSEKIREEHRQLKTFGVGADIRKEDWQRYINELIARDYLRKSEGQYPLLQLGQKASAVLKGVEKVMLTQQKQTIASTRVSQEYEVDLFEQLRTLRRSLAEEENVPAYIVLSDTSLVEMATYLPHNTAEVEMISGFGEVKVEKYGRQFCEAVVQYAREKGLQSRMHLKKVKLQRKERSTKTERVSDTKHQTLELYRSGKSLPEIAAQRGFSLTTIETHLTFYIEDGTLPIDDFVPYDKAKRIRQVIEEQPDQRLAPIKEILGEEFSYNEIRMVVASMRSQRGV